LQRKYVPKKKKLQPPEPKKEKEPEDELNELENATEVILRLLNTDSLFGDLAIQFHFGQQVADKDLGWHTDSSNSILHMATAIHGRRALHSHRAKKHMDKEALEVVEWQNPGDIYLSSPALFMHSVEYPENPKWETRIIAIQSRFLVTYHDYNCMRSTRFQGGIPWKMLLSLVSLSLSEAKFTVPTLAQIKQMEKELAEIEKEENLQKIATTTTTTTTTKSQDKNSEEPVKNSLYEN